MKDERPSAPTLKNGLVIRDLGWASRTVERQPYFPEADSVQNPDIVSYICMLLDFNIMAFYTFESKGNKVPIPKQHELRMPFPFKCFYSPPKKWIKSADLISPHLLLRVMLLSQVINIISLMASFFKAARQWMVQRKTHHRKVFDVVASYLNEHNLTKEIAKL